MKVNNDRAISFGELICHEFPNIYWYIPGEHDEFVLIAYKNKLLTEEQILSIDCEIIDTCNFMLVFSPDDYISRGMKVEIDHCMYKHIPIISAVDGNYEEYITRLKYSINCYLTSCMR